MLTRFPMRFAMKTKGLFSLVALVAASGLTPAPASAQSDTVSVFAAASLANVLREIAQKLKAQEHLQLRLSLGSSSSLAKQIQQGAPAEIFLSANREWMGYLDSLGMVEGGSCFDLLGNKLVVIAPKGEGFRVEARQGFDFAGAFKGRLAIGDPGHVPAGIYAR